MSNGGEKVASLKAPLIKISAFKEGLSKIVGSANASFRSVDCAPYARDAFSPLMEIFFGSGGETPIGVVAPVTTEEISRVLILVNEFDSRRKEEEKVKVLPYTFGTSMSGAAVPTEKNVVMLDLKRMDKIIEIDEESMTATVEPAVSFGRLDKEAKTKGLGCVSKIGGFTGSLVGNFLTANVRPFNAPYGWSDPIVNLEVVLPTGDIIRTGSMGTAAGETNPYARYTGPDPIGLFRGSYGAFGIITKAIVRLFPESLCTVVVAWFSDLNDALLAMNEIQRNNLGWSAFMFNSAEVAEVSTTFDEKHDPLLMNTLAKTLPKWCMAVELGNNDEGLHSAAVRFVLSTVQAHGGEPMEYGRTAAEQPTRPRFAAHLGEKWCDVEAATRDYSSHKGSLVMHGMSFFLAPFYMLLPLHQVPKFMDNAEALVLSAGLKDPLLKNRPVRVEKLLIPYDRGTTYLCGCSVDYDPTDEDQVSGASGFLMSMFQQVGELGGAIPTMMKMFSDAYDTTPLLKKIRAISDPNGVMSTKIF